MQAGQLWRLLTAHLVQPTPGVAVVDLLGLLLGGTLLELRSRVRLALLLAAAAAVVGLAVHLDARVQHYEGASGLTSATLLAATLAGLLSWRGLPRAAAGAALLLCLAKVLAEAAGSSWWGGAPAPGLHVSTTAHLAGAAVGLLAGPAFRSRMRPS